MEAIKDFSAGAKVDKTYIFEISLKQMSQRMKKLEPRIPARGLLQDYIEN